MCVCVTAREREKKRNENKELLKTVLMCLANVFFKQRDIHSKFHKTNVEGRKKTTTQIHLLCT